MLPFFLLWNVNLLWKSPTNKRKKHVFGEWHSLCHPVRRQSSICQCHSSVGVHLPRAVTTDRRWWTKNCCIEYQRYPKMMEKYQETGKVDDKDILVCFHCFWVGLDSLAKKRCDTTLVRLVIDHENDREIWLLNYHFFVIRSLIYNIQVRLWTRFWFWATELRIQISVLATKSLTCAMVASHKSCSPEKKCGDPSEDTQMICQEMQTWLILGQRNNNSSSF